MSIPGFRQRPYSHHPTTPATQTQLPPPTALAGLIARRALHPNFVAQDDGSPLQEVREGIKTIARAYEQARAADRFSYYIEEDVGHVLSAEMWR